MKLNRRGPTLSMARKISFPNSMLIGEYSTSKTFLSVPMCSLVQPTGFPADKSMQEHEDGMLLVPAVSLQNKWHKTRPRGGIDHEWHMWQDSDLKTKIPMVESPTLHWCGSAHT